MKTTTKAETALLGGRAESPPAPDEAGEKKKTAAGRAGETTMPNNILTVAQAAEILGVCRRRVLDRIEAGSLAAKKIGRDWLIRRSAVEALAASKPRPGRPRKRMKPNAK